MSQINFLPKNSAYKFDGSHTILEVALKNKIEINHSCGGMGSCGTCRVIVRKGQEGLAERNEIEKTMAEDRGFHDNERLACQTRVIANLSVEIPN